MTAVTTSDVYYDPYDVEIQENPYPVFQRLREEAPLYYNERFDFYALSRFDDVEKALLETRTFSSAKGDILEGIKAGFDPPSGIFISEDPPVHTVHRGVLARVFTPKKVSALEPKVREYCAQVLDPLVGVDRFDFVADFGAIMPMRMIGMLLGIPEEDQQTVRERGDNRIRREPGKPREQMQAGAIDESFNQYLEWRLSNPSDDLMTELLRSEFDDPKTSQRRTFTQREVLGIVGMLATAGNETTNRLIAWTAKLLSDHPDQRQELVEDRSLIPNAIEEILRYEPSTVQLARLVTREVEYYGQTVPAGSVVLLLCASANRDHRRFADPDRFDIHRRIEHPLTFGFGIHFCIGAALARLEGRVALDEVLDRFPNWVVDMEHAELDHSAVRGWRTLPASIG